MTYRSASLTRKPRSQCGRASCSFGDISALNRRADETAGAVDREMVMAVLPHSHRVSSVYLGVLVGLSYCGTAFVPAVRTPLTPRSRARGRARRILSDRSIRQDPPFPRGGRKDIYEVLRQKEREVSRPEGGSEWRTTKFGLRSGVIGIRRRVTSRISPRVWGVGEAICTMREVVAVVDRPQDIEDEEPMSFFGGSEDDADESQG